MSMQVFTARVKGGAIVPDEGVELPEGSRVTVIADEREVPFELSPQQEAELAESIAEAIGLDLRAVWGDPPASR